MLAASFAAVAGYLIGIFPTATLVGRVTGRDPNSLGSANPGASNTYRISGRTAGAVVLAGDLAKGAIAVGLGFTLGGRAAGAVAALAAVVGHMAPITRGFRGGKGAATAGGASLALWPIVGVVMAGLFAGAIVLTHRASVGSLVMAGALPVGVAVAGRPGWEVAFAAALSGLVILRHHSNIRRLLRGDEHGLSRPETEVDP